MPTAGRHDSHQTFGAFDVDAIDVPNGTNHQAWSGELIRLDNGGTVTLPDVTGGWVQIVRPNGVTWDAGTNGGPVVTSALGAVVIDLSAVQVGLLLGTADTSWTIHHLYDDFVVQIVRYTPGGVAVIEVQRLSRDLVPVGTPEYLSGIPPTAWVGDPGTLLDSKP